MFRWRLWVDYPFAWLLSLIWFAIFQPWGTFNDPDAFYHAKISALMLERGPLHAFPWLDLTLFDERFSDHHFLFHLFLMPFIKLFGMFSGTQIAAIVLAATFLAALYAILKNLKLAHPILWTALAAISSPLLIRLSLAKASPLALLWFVLGLWLLTKEMETKHAILFKERKWVLLVAILIGFLYSWSHGGWIIVLVGQGLLMVGGLLVDRFVFDKPWKSSLARLPWLIPLATGLGAVLGTCLHPNFPKNVLFLKTLLIDISLRVPFQHVRLGDEWQPARVMELLAGLGPLLVAAGLVVFGLVSAVRRPLQIEQAKRAIGLALLVALFLALTLKSRRAAEYLIPVMIMWLASLWTLVDVPRCIESLRVTWHELVGTYRKTLSGLFVTLLLTLLVHDAYGTWYLLHTYTHPFNEFRSAMSALSARAQPGDRVFHSDWDLFPQLWALDDRIRYVAGMDPTMFWKHRPELSDHYREIALGETTTGVFEQIRDLFQARFVFLERHQHEAFENVLTSDDRFQEIYRDDEVRVYELSTVSH